MSPSVLIAGASGLVGSAAVDRFLDLEWDVVAVSRRPPEVESQRPFTRVSVDLRDRDATAAVLGELPHITHVVYAALFEKPGLIEGWLERDQMETNDAMLRNTLSPLLAAGSVEHVSLLQGTKAYGIHLHPIPIPARERLPRDDHENFYWYQENYIREVSDSHGLAYTILRPQVIFGGVYGVAMSMVPIIGAFAALCREEDLPFGFPGGPEFIQEGVDTRLLADALSWAAVEPAAVNQTFNVTNGDIYTWRGLWPAIADTLGIESAADERRQMTSFFIDHVAAWDRIVAKHDLRRIGLLDLCGESHYYADCLFGYDLEERPPYGLVSTIKIRQAGFRTYCDTEDTLRHWLGVLMRRRVIPPAPA